MSLDKKTFTLYELTQSIQRAISSIYNKTYWVKAEMHKLNYTAKGHCYPELVHKENDVIVAEMRGTIWANNFHRMRLQFEEVVKEPLRDGLTLLFQVKINFHSIYGMGLEILDIDPHYTLGELHKEREETLKKLKAKGILNKNQQLSLPILPKNIAIISVASSKGLSDFMTVLNENPYGYRFNTKLFPAILNGDGAVESIIQQLKKIYKYRSFFDAVVIVRGGGGEIGMTCYNNYALCETIVEFPLPILTGIGHSTNLTVAEMIAYHSAITPTQLAGFFIDAFLQFDHQITELKRILIEESNYLLDREKKEIVNEFRVFRNVSMAHLIQNRKDWEQHKVDLIRFSTTLQKGKVSLLKTAIQSLQITSKTQQKVAQNSLEFIQQKVKTDSQRFCYEKGNLLLDFKVFILNNSLKTVENSQKNIEQIETTIRIVHPDNLLKKGYSITLYDGKAINKNNFPVSGSRLKTITHEGEIDSTVD